MRSAEKVYHLPTPEQYWGQWVVVWNNEYAFSCGFTMRVSPLRHIKIPV